MADTRPFHWEYTPDPVAREVFRIEGGRPLAGTVRISGAKNAALKLLAASVLTGERCRFTNVPEIEDVHVMVATLVDLGVVVDHPAPGVYEVASGDVDWLFVPLEAAAKMRASFILLGPLLSRFGHVIMSNPGGDRIGRRPVNLHVDAMRALGAEIEYRNGYYFARAPGRLRGAEHNVIPDRIEAGTFVVATAVAGGHVTLLGAPCEHLGAFLETLAAMGVNVACGRDTIEVRGIPPGEGAYRACDVETGPYPGLATDLQSPVSVLLTRGDGTSHVHETIFEDRLEWLTELGRMGARVEIADSRHAAITGPTQLHGAEVSISDLRAGASLILGALAADGTSVIHGAHHVQRGYENIDSKFHDLGARIERLPEPVSTPTP
jgi:UDP-N-acetylglucosamine enolpyruvyl transferase